MQHVDPIVPLSQLIDATPEQCRARGLRWWLTRALAERRAISSIMALREAAGIGLGTAKALCEGIASSPAGMEEVIVRLERGDLTNAASDLRRHYHLNAPSDRYAPERVALALARAFDLPCTEIETELCPPPELETLASAAGWSLEETRERGLFAWLQAMMPEGPSVGAIVAASEATGLELKATMDLLRELRADAELARRMIEAAEGTATGVLAAELTARTQCKPEEAHALVSALRAAFG